MDLREGLIAGFIFTVSVIAGLLGTYGLHVLGLL